ncbi:hypothetical protein [Actinacidiphila sp. ITFR-21]|uniref:hypothetical protein n=1 Tax=Actinacidiphila sp. ITFR-21 TaxID=3075199 RepID=UPI00288BB50F|nr:hypothetical protein [Streptomyces sp. ITFR-21]WNI19276.1 hypothetical protein RLT57_29505 [Streptomyces sp. ITFR-21]
MDLALPVGGLLLVGVRQVGGCGQQLVPHHLAGLDVHGDGDRRRVPGRAARRLLVDIGGPSARVVVAAQGVERRADLAALVRVGGQSPQQVADLARRCWPVMSATSSLPMSTFGLVADTPGGEGVGALGVQVGQREPQPARHGGPLDDGGAQRVGVVPDGDRADDGERTQGGEQGEGRRRARSESARPRPGGRAAGRRDGR